MVIGYDSMVPPTAQQARDLFLAGGRVYFGYLPFPGAARGWTFAEFSTVRQAGFVVHPIVFPAADIRRAIDLARAWGFHSLCLDVEANDQTDPTSRLDAITAGGLTSMLYSLRTVCDRYGAHAMLRFIAEYGNKPASVPANTAVQWWNSHREMGVTVDQSLCDDAFLLGAPAPQPTPPSPPGEPMTKRELIAHFGQVYAVAGLYAEPPKVLLPYDPNLQQAFSDHADAVLNGTNDIQSESNAVFKTISGR